MGRWYLVTFQHSFSLEKLDFVLDQGHVKQYASTATFLTLSLGNFGKRCILCQVCFRQFISRTLPFHDQGSSLWRNSFFPEKLYMFGNCCFLKWLLCSDHHVEISAKGPSLYWYCNGYWLHGHSIGSELV